MKLREGLALVAGGSVLIGGAIGTGVAAVAGWTVGAIGGAIYGLVAGTWAGLKQCVGKPLAKMAAAGNIFSSAGWLAVAVGGALLGVPVLAAVGTIATMFAGAKVVDKVVTHLCWEKTKDAAVKTLEYIGEGETEEKKAAKEAAKAEKDSARKAEKDAQEIENKTKLAQKEAEKSAKEKAKQDAKIAEDAKKAEKEKAKRDEKVAEETKKAAAEQVKREEKVAREQAKQAAKSKELAEKKIGPPTPGVSTITPSPIVAPAIASPPVVPVATPIAQVVPPVVPAASVPTSHSTAHTSPASRTSVSHEAKFGDNPPTIPMWKSAEQVLAAKNVKVEPYRATAKLISFTENNKSCQFIADNKQLTSTDTHKETFAAMLESYKATYQDRLPQITTSEAQKVKMTEAVLHAYKDKPELGQKIVDSIKTHEEIAKASIAAKAAAAAPAPAPEPVVEAHRRP